MSIDTLIKPIEQYFYIQSRIDTLEEKFNAIIIGAPVLELAKIEYQISCLKHLADEENINLTVDELDFHIDLLNQVARYDDNKEERELSSAGLLEMKQLKQELIKRNLI